MKFRRNVIWLVIWVILAVVFGLLDAYGYALYTMVSGVSISRTLMIVFAILAGYQLGVLTINALTAASEVIIPLQPHFFALQGLSKLLSTTALVSRRLNRNLKVTGIMLCLYEAGTRLATDVCDDLNDFLERSEGDTPWSGAKIFESRIRRNIKLAEAPSYGQSVFDYDSKCNGAEDYGNMVKEVLAMQQPVLEPIRIAA